MELNHLYQACDALIFASYAEGFGLAIVEAAQHGVPLILRDLPVFREVAGESAFYFHANEPVELAVAVKAWLELSNNGHAPSSKGVSCLTWEESTRMLLSSIGIACVPAHPSAGINPADTLW
jgi:glycosyltransferase involved in cell wall biosynthesis